MTAVASRPRSRREAGAGARPRRSPDVRSRAILAERGADVLASDARRRRRRRSPASTIESRWTRPSARRARRRSTSCSRRPGISPLRGFLAEVIARGVPVDLRARARRPADRRAGRRRDGDERQDDGVPSRRTHRTRSRARRVRVRQPRDEVHHRGARASGRRRVRRRGVELQPLRSATRSTRASRS